MKDSKARVSHVLVDLMMHFSLKVINSTVC